MRIEDLRLRLPASEDFQLTLFLAQSAAEARKSPHTDTQHLLIGLAHAPAPNVFSRLGYSRDFVSRMLLSVDFTRSHEPQANVINPPLHSRTIRGIELAQDAAEVLGHDRLYTGHMLLGLIREGEGMAYDLLYSFGITEPSFAGKRHYLFTEAIHAAKFNRSS